MKRIQLVCAFLAILSLGAFTSVFTGCVGATTKRTIYNFETSATTGVTGAIFGWEQYRSAQVQEQRVRKQTIQAMAAGPDQDAAWIKLGEDNLKLAKANQRVKKAVAVWQTAMSQVVVLADQAVNATNAVQVTELIGNALKAAEQDLTNAINEGKQ